MSKIFLLDPKIHETPKDYLAKAATRHAMKIADAEFNRDTEKSLRFSQMPNLKSVEGKVIIQIDMAYKDSWKFADGTKIYYGRDFDNFNRRYTQPVNAWVIDGENMEKGTEILIHPNAISEHFRIYDCGKNGIDEIRYYSIPEDMCFCYRNGDEWLPLKPYEKALRVFKPYTGSLTGIEPTMIKNCLYVLTGDLKSKVVLTVIASDYEVIFQDINGREGNLIRFRPNGDGKEREPEAIAIQEEYTNLISCEKLLVGFTKSDAKTLSEWQKQ